MPNYTYFAGMKSIRLIVILTILAGLSTLIYSCNKPQSFEYRDLRNFNITTLDFNKSVVSMDLVYFNPNSFGVTLKNVTADIYVDKSYVGKYVLDTSLFIAKKSEFALPSKMEVDMKNLLKNAVSSLFNKEVLIDVTGTTRVGKAGIYITVPIKYSGRHQLSLF